MCRDVWDVYIMAGGGLIPMCTVLPFDGWSVGAGLIEARGQECFLRVHRVIC